LVSGEKVKNKARERGRKGAGGREYHRAQLDLVTERVCRYDFITLSAGYAELKSQSEELEGAEVYEGTAVCSLFADLSLVCFHLAQLRQGAGV
jgi:hypothetical protein